MNGLVVELKKGTNEGGEEGGGEGEKLGSGIERVKGLKRKVSAYIHACIRFKA